MCIFSSKHGGSHTVTPTRRNHSYWSRRRPASVSEAIRGGERMKADLFRFHRWGGRARPCRARRLRRARVTVVRRVVSQPRRKEVYFFFSSSEKRGKADVLERKNVQEPNRGPQGIGTIHWGGEKPAVRPASLGGRQDECETRD